MSGGSFHYLFAVAPSDLFLRREEIDQMIEALTSMGAADAAKETTDIQLILEHFEVTVGARMARLAKVWKAVEWKVSGDSDEVEAALTEYRTLGAAPEVSPDRAQRIRETVRTKLKEATGYEWPKAVNEIVAALTEG